MTHEQKPESAEFRTLESGFRSRPEQATALASDTTHPCPYPFKSDVIERHLVEAEARGAAAGHLEATLEFAHRNEAAMIRDSEKGIKGEPYWRAYMQAVFEDPSTATEEEALECVETIIREFKKLGAAEQRRKDAEGVEPVAYRWAYRVGEKGRSPWAFGENPPSSSLVTKDPIHVSPLYTRPANVAALEARVKELEGALADVSKADDLGAKPDYHRCPVDQLAFEIAWMCEEAELSANDLVIVNREKLRTIARRVVARAAIREASEHG